MTDAQKRSKRRNRRAKALDRVAHYVTKMKAIQDAGGIVRPVFYNRRSILRGAFRDSKKAMLKRIQDSGAPRKFARKNINYPFKRFIYEIMKLQAKTLKAKK